MDLLALQNFVILARTGSFNKAQDEVAMTPPALKYQLDQLEKEIGVRLFKRSHTGLRLTKAGEAYLDAVQRSIGELEQARLRALELQAEQDNSIYVGGVLHPPFEDPIYASAFARIRKEMPNLHVYVPSFTEAMSTELDVSTPVPDHDRGLTVQYLLRKIQLYCFYPTYSSNSFVQEIKADDIDLRDTILPDMTMNQLFTGPLPELVSHLGPQANAYDIATTGRTSVIGSSITSEQPAIMIGRSSSDPLGYPIVPVVDSYFLYSIFSKQNPKEAVQKYIDFIVSYYNSIDE